MTSSNLPTGETSIYERNRLIFNAGSGDEAYEAVMLKAKEICRVLASLEPRVRVADVGCHWGVSTVEYGKVKGVGSIEGFDIADEALKELKKKGIPGHRWTGGLEVCPVADHTYDVVIASEVIEHIVDTEFFVRELHRIIRPGGHAIITTPNLYYWLSRLKFLIGKAPWSYPAVSSEFKVDPNILTEHIRVNGIGEWTAFFAARGFQVVKTEGLSWASPVTFKGRMIRLIDRFMPKNALCLGLFILKKEGKG